MYTEEMNKVALSSNDNKRECTQSKRDIKNSK